MFRTPLGLAATTAVTLACLLGTAATTTTVAATAAVRAPARSGAELHAFVHAVFRSRERYAQVVVLSAERVPAGAVIAVACRGRDAPHVARTLVADATGTTDLAPLFGHRRLYVGDRLSVTIRDAGATRRFLYTIHARLVAVADTR